MASISVVIPAKNEEQSLGAVLSAVGEIGKVHEIVVVDDGSLDATGEVARRAGAKVVRHESSLGNGAAIKSGARVASGDYIVFMDADGQHRPSDIPGLIDHAFDGGWDMVVGARAKSGQASFFRYLANSFYNWFSSKVSGQEIKDLTSGFRVVRREKFLRFLHLLPNGFSYPTTSTMAFLRSGYRVDFMPVKVERREGDSHIRPIRDGLRFLIIIFKVTTLFSPLKVFLPVSALFFALGLLRYIYTYIEMGAFTNMSALLLVTSVQVFLMGLVSEQITALIYRDAN